MSYVTNAILTFDIMEAERTRMLEVQQFFGDEAGFVSADFWSVEREPEFAEQLASLGPATVAAVKRWYGGTKALEKPLYVAAFNYLDVEGLIKHVRTMVKWEHPECVQLMLCEQERNRFTVYEVGEAAARRDQHTEERERLLGLVSELKEHIAKLYERLGVRS